MPSDTSNTDMGGGVGDGVVEPGKDAPIYFSLQYIKDLSFENPRAPEIYQDFEEPNVGINVNVGARNLRERVFEVLLRLSAEAKNASGTTFLAEIEYAGIAHVSPDIPEENIQPLVLIEGPRILYPFARAIIANLTRDAAFPLLLLGHMDFVSMYRDGVAQQAAQQGEQPQG
jgi:preprotein translocase subunit SecB